MALRCEEPISTVAVRYDLKIELLDNDGFVLRTVGLDSQDHQGDLLPGQTHTVYDDITVEYSRVKALASSRVTPKSSEDKRAVGTRAASTDCSAVTG